MVGRLCMLSFSFRESLKISQKLHESIHSRPTMQVFIHNMEEITQVIVIVITHILKLNNNQITSYTLSQKTKRLKLKWVLTHETQTKRPPYALHGASLCSLD